MNDCSHREDMRHAWKILIADDDADVHEVTRMVLRGVRFRGRPLEFIDAYSAAETIEALHKHPDTAVVFLDVIMETDDAGLCAARHIRECGFNLVRIIVRTGFPGQAPERRVVLDYDIHDYKEKSELTVQKLLTSTLSALRAYDDLVALENHRRSLMSVLESVSWFDFNAIQRYIAGMLAEFSSLTGLRSDQVVMVSRCGTQARATVQVVATLGEWRTDAELLRFEDLPPDISAIILETLRTESAQESAGGGTLYFRRHGIDLVVFAAGSDVFSQTDQVLLDVFMDKACQALSNQTTFSNMLDERNAMFRGLGLRAERRHGEGGAALDGLMELACAIARRLETTLVFPDAVDDAFVRDIGAAAALHDLGNEALPPDLLTKPAAFSEDERRSMQTHVAKGLERLRDFASDAQNSGALTLARQVIAGHHEHFDGGGYPAGLRGDAIPPAARIVALADSFIALTAARPHRPALSDEQACALIASGSGSRFDPRVVQAFMTVIGQEL